MCKWHNKAEPRADFDVVWYSIAAREIERVDTAKLFEQETAKRKTKAKQQLKRILPSWPVCENGAVTLIHENGGHAFYNCTCIEKRGTK